MADPIEIIQTVIAVLKGIHGAVQCIKGAPDEQKTLETEVHRLHLVLEYLVQILGGRVQDKQPEREIRALQGLCDEARKLIDLANGTLGDGKTKGYTLRKIEWPLWLLRKSNREDLVKQLQKLNAALDTFFSYDGHREQSRFRAEVEGGLQVVTGQMQGIRHDVRESRGNISDMLQDMSRSLAQQDHRGEALYYLLVQCIMRSSGRDQSREVNQHYDQVTTMKTTSLGPRHLSLTTVAPNLSVTYSESSVQPEDSPPSAAIHYISSCQVDLSNDRCPPTCRCRCHRPTISVIPKWLHNIAGRLLIHHDWLSAIASARTPCDDRRCRRHRSNLLQIRYYCPTWFAQVNAEIRTERLPVHFVIQTPRAVEDLDWLEDATLDEVRQALWSRELTVNDVDLDGRSVLHHMTVRLTVDGSDAALSIVALLTEHSAPADWEYEGVTPIERALHYLFMLRRQHGSLAAAFKEFQYRLGPYFPQDIEDAYDGLATNLHRTELHRLVFLLSSVVTTSIPAELVPQVNIADSLGWTPLFCAALVHPEAIHALLAAGANPRIDSTILNYAARFGADAAISMLVRAGTYIAASDVYNRTVLHSAADPDAAHFFDGFAMALQLVRHAGHLLDWDARDDQGCTPLDLAHARARNNINEDSKRILELYQTQRLPEGAQYIPTSLIIDMGDDAAGDDSIDLPPPSLIRTALRGNVEAIGGLIRRGAMVNERDHNGLTLLHLVALGRVPNAYRVALELIRHGGWGVDWDALVAVSGQEDVNDGEDEVVSVNHIRNETKNSDEISDDVVARLTALEIAQGRLDEKQLTKQERVELKKILNLLHARRLPLGEEYLWPCMDPDFYKSKPEPEPTPMSRMPGAWDNE